jgi:hypothetical protein
MIKEHILLERSAHSDRLKAILCFRALYKAIIDHIYKHFFIPVPPESFPFYVLKENLVKSKGNPSNMLRQSLG